MAADSNQIVLRGILHADGLITLDEAPDLPVGPVEVTVQPLSKLIHRLPDPPIDDVSISPPFDLPRLGPIREVQPRRVTRRLPDPLLDEETQE